MIELRQLRYLIAASEAGSFSRAAHRLNIKQATLSRQIAYIEKRLGLLLFERQPGGAILTLEGRHYLTAARRVVDEFAEINDWVRGQRSGNRGRLSIGFYTSLSAGNLRSTLADFAAQYPDVDIHQVERDRCHLLDGLNNGTLDIAIMLGGAAYLGVARRSLWSERLILAFAADYPLEECRPVRWPDIADETFLLSQSDPGPELGRIVTCKTARADRAPTIIFADVCRETILNTIARGRHVTVVSEGSAGNRLDGIRFRAIDDRDGETRVAFSGYWREDNQPLIGRREPPSFLQQRDEIRTPGVAGERFEALLGKLFHAPTRPADPAAGCQARMPASPAAIISAIGFPGRSPPSGKPRSRKRITSADVEIRS